MSLKREVYFGPAEGFYERGSFRRFVEGPIIKSLGSIGRMSIEEHDPSSVTYHFPDAHMGIRYSQMIEKNSVRCRVEIVATNRGAEHAKSIKNLITSNE